jgi:hypothetical protein
VIRSLDKGVGVEDNDQSSIDWVSPGLSARKEPLLFVFVVALTLHPDRYIPLAGS